MFVSMAESHEAAWYIVNINILRGDFNVEDDKPRWSYTVLGLALPHLLEPKFLSTSTQIFDSLATTERRGIFAQDLCNYFVIVVFFANITAFFSLPSKSVLSRICCRQECTRCGRYCLRPSCPPCDSSPIPSYFTLLAVIFVASFGSQLRDCLIMAMGQVPVRILSLSLSCRIQLTKGPLGRSFRL